MTCPEKFMELLKESDIDEELVAQVIFYTTIRLCLK